MCSSPIASRTGQYSHMATEQELLGGKSAADGGEEETVEYPVRVMKYIPGELMDRLDKCYLTPQLSYDVGHYVGKMDHALQVYSQCIQAALCDLPSMKKGVVHGDVNGLNNVLLL